MVAELTAAANVPSDVDVVIVAAKLGAQFLGSLASATLAMSAAPCTSLHPHGPQFALLTKIHCIWTAGMFESQRLRRVHEEVALYCIPHVLLTFKMVPGHGDSNGCVHAGSNGIG